jgi:hypothetical protein
MSIVTLKRKTAAAYNSQSVGVPQFSINGTRRSQGYIGQTMLSRSLPRTPMKGNVPKGHGGCCGQFPIHTIIQSGVTSVNDSTVVKLSSINTLEMIATKHRWIRRPYPYAAFKFTVVDSSDRLNTLRQKTLQCDFTNTCTTNTAKPVATVKPECYHCTPISKPGIITVDDSTHIGRLNANAANIPISDVKKMYNHTNTPTVGCATGISISK